MSKAKDTIEKYEAMQDAIGEYVDAEIAMHKADDDDARIELTLTSGEHIAKMKLSGDVEEIGGEVCLLLVKEMLESIVEVFELEPTSDE